MYDGKQVLRFHTQYKSSDIYNIGNEMERRKGTGNYDKDRTQFNITYIDYDDSNLYQAVKNKLANENIEYLKKNKTNMLNGVTITSGPEFFQTLGMKFIDSGRTYQSGDKKGQAILVPDIKNKNDIPYEINYYFDYCLEYLKNNIGEENIVLAQIHYDEDTPHLQAYFLPVVNHVNRKCFQKDNNGNIVKEISKSKDGTQKLVPKLLRDNNGKIIYENISGKFLNNDQFWKDKGGIHSYSKFQDSFNEFITSKGFNLYRGNVGSNKIHQNKLEYEVNELKAQIDNLKEELSNYDKQIELDKVGIENIVNSVNNDVLNPKKNIAGYSIKEVDKLIEYSKSLEKNKEINKIEIIKNNNELELLKKENEHFKRNNELVNKNKIIKVQEDKINEQNLLIKSLQNTIDKFEKKLELEVNKWIKRFNKLCKVIDYILHRKPMEYVEDYEELAEEIINKHDKKHDKDDKEIKM